MTKINTIENTLINKALSYTSRGNKFVYHPKEIWNYINGNGNSIISAHIAPTNKCNLNCTYCNQSNRTKGKFLELDTIKEFVNGLIERGLKAVIITGGGEPTIYPQFNELTSWLKEQGLNTALITNGTNNRTGKKSVETWDTFDWIRASLNFFKEKLIPLKIPEYMNKGNVGMSLVYQNHTLDMLKQVADVAEKYNARYVRIIPDCCKDTESIIQERDMLKELFYKLGYNRFFVQDKIPAQAKLATCHQSKIRPFLLPDGTVAPCDCYMLNRNENGEFYKTLPPNFNLASDTAHPITYLEYLDGKRMPEFNPVTSCNGCGFLENNQILENLTLLHKKYPDEPVENLFARLGQFRDKSVTDRNFV